MAEVYVRFTNDPVARTVLNEEGDIRCDLTSGGVLVGVSLAGAISVTVDGEYIGQRADTWELAALAAISERLGKETAERVGARMREIVFGKPPEVADADSRP